MLLKIDCTIKVLFIGQTAPKSISVRLAIYSSIDYRSTSGKQIGFGLCLLLFLLWSSASLIKAPATCSPGELLTKAFTHEYAMSNYGFTVLLQGQSDRLHNVRVDEEGMCKKHRR